MIWVLLSVSLVRAQSGEPRFFISQIVDISSRVVAEQQALEQTAITRAIINSMGDVVIVAGRDGHVLLMNAEGERLFGPVLMHGFPNEWTPGHGLFLADQVTRCEPTDYPIARALRGESIDQMELWMSLPGWPTGQWHSVTANPVRDEHGRLLGAVNVGRDITSRKAMEEAVRRASLTDELTGLYNRRGFTLLAEQRIRVATRHYDPLCLFFLDLDGMKQINDVLGHELGDEALVEAAKLLAKTCRAADIIARLGGDEFVILAEGTQSDGSVLKERLQSALEGHNHAPNRKYRLSWSIGMVSETPEATTSLADLLTKADQAMYEVKRERRRASGMRAHG